MNHEGVRPMTMQEFITALEHAKPGAQIVYFEGFLPRAHAPAAASALDAYYDGKVELVQKRLTHGYGSEAGTSRYIAIKRNFIKPPRIQRATGEHK